MDLALYDPEVGYYARAVQRSGRSGDFFTSVDVGPLFGELLEVQLSEMFETARQATVKSETAEGAAVSAFDVVEAGAGNGRLSSDILAAARQHHPDFYDAIRLTLVEASANARAAHHDVLGLSVDRLQASVPTLPDAFEGVLFA